MRKGSEQQLEQLLGVTPDDRERGREREAEGERALRELWAMRSS